MPVDEIQLYEGEQLFIGAPAQPMAKSVSDAAADAVSRLPVVREAHLPLIYIQDRTPTAEQMLVVVLDRIDDSDTINALTRTVNAALPEGFHLVVWPLTPDHPMLASVREAHCQIAGPPAPAPRVTRPWWRFWR